MAISKRFLKSKPVCKVTFKITAEEAHAAKTAKIVGEFNEWSPSAHPMKRLKNGTFTTTVDLQKGREYQFRYLLDEKLWQNDIQADKFVTSPYGDSENSVVIV